MRILAIGSALAALLLAGCSSDNAVPSAPGGSGGIADIRGTWAQVNDDTRTWVLDQAGIQAGGTASFSQVNTPGVGAVSGTGGVLGAVLLGTFRFAETYERVSISSRPSPNDCYVNTDGQLAISGNTMRGSVTESLGCAGVRVNQTTRDLVMQRQ
jgi:hypothetical protein